MSMRKKTTFLILLILLFISFSNVKAEEQKPDLIIEADGVRIISKSEDQYGRYQIGLTIKNIGTATSTLNGVATLIYGTNHADIDICKLGNCFGKANIYNAKMNMNSLGKNTLAPEEKYEIIFNKQNYLLDNIEFEPGVEYSFKAIVDDEQAVNELSETNNIYEVGIVPVKEENLPDLTIKNFKYYPTENDQGISTQAEFDIVNGASKKANFNLSVWNNTINSPLKNERYSLDGNKEVLVYLMDVNNISRLLIGENKITVKTLSLDSQKVYSKQDFIIVRKQQEDKDLKNNDRDSQIKEIGSKAKTLNDGKISELLAEIKLLRDQLREQAAEMKYLKAYAADMKALNSNMQSAIKAFIAYGVDDNTKKLGEGERAAVVNSYKAAFDKLPETEVELADAIKIANGRWPSVTSGKAEKQAKEKFIKIYKRNSDLNNDKDNAAIKVMAYGLRQRAENRNLNSEKTGVKIFKAIYGRTPKTTEEWNIMQAITYSGAAR